MFQRNQQANELARQQMQSRKKALKDLAHENKELLMSRHGGGHDYKERLQREHQQKVMQSENMAQYQQRLNEEMKLKEQTEMMKKLKQQEEYRASLDN